MSVQYAANHLGPILSREQCRRLDQLAMERYGMSGLVLMENAGRGAVDVLCRLEGCFAPEERPEGAAGEGPLHEEDSGASALGKGKVWRRLRTQHQDFGGPVVICCGRGNNAGDGLVMARHLWLRGHSVQVFLWSKPEDLTPDAAANYAILHKAGFPIECCPPGRDPERLAQALAKASWIVDALLGTGARGQPRPPLDAVISQLNGAKKPILAVDLPSGLDCDTGQPAQPTIRAAVTCTFAAAKPGLLRPEAQPYVGRLLLVDIGTPPQLFQELLASAYPNQPERGATSSRDG